MQNKKDGGNRRFILIEQLQKHIDVCRERLQKVIQQENTAESFVYCELAKANQSFVEQIIASKTLDELQSVTATILKYAFLKYRINNKKLKESIKDIEQLSLKQQKTLLIELLDLNFLYIPSAEMADSRYNINATHQNLTLAFYGQPPKKLID